MPTYLKNMRLIHALVVTIFSLGPVALAVAASESATSRLWYDRQASTWTDALPIGNGRLAAMVYGTFPRERIQLNEETIWDGEVVDRANPLALATLPKIRTLLFENKATDETAKGRETAISEPSSTRSLRTLNALDRPDDIARADQRLIPRDCATSPVDRMV